MPLQYFLDTPRAYQGLHLRLYNIDKTPLCYSFFSVFLITNWAFIFVHFRLLASLTSSCGLETAGSSLKKLPSTSLQLPLLPTPRQESSLSLGGRIAEGAFRVTLSGKIKRLILAGLFYTGMSGVRSKIWCERALMKVLMVNVAYITDPSNKILLWSEYLKASHSTPRFLFLHMLFCVSLRWIGMSWGWIILYTKRVISHLSSVKEGLILNGNCCDLLINTLHCTVHCVL